MKFDLLVAHILIVLLSIENATSANNRTSMIIWIVGSVIFGMHTIMDIANIMKDR